MNARHIQLHIGVFWRIFVWWKSNLAICEPIISTYRVSHFEMDFMNWLWRIKICNLDLVWGWFWNAEKGNFWVPQPFLKKITPTSLNSLRQKEYHISLKSLVFDDPFHKKGPVLVILVPGMIQSSGSGSFLMKWGFRGCWGH